MTRTNEDSSDDLLSIEDTSADRHLRSIDIIDVTGIMHLYSNIYYEMLEPCKNGCPPLHRID